MRIGAKMRVISHVIWCSEDQYGKVGYVVELHDYGGAAPTVYVLDIRGSDNPIPFESTAVKLVKTKIVKVRTGRESAR